MSAVVSIDFVFVRERLSRQLPDMLVTHILQLKDPKKIMKKIATINAVAEKISKHAQEHRGYAINMAGLAYAFTALRNDGLAKAFVGNPVGLANALMKLAEYTREGSGGWLPGAFAMLEKTDVGAVFAQNPDATLDLFRRISDAAGKNRARAFAVLASSESGNFFARNMKDLAEISSYVGESTPSFFVSLQYRGALRAIFDTNKNILMVSLKSIKNYSGRSSKLAFQILEGCTDLFAMHPEAFVEISKSARELTGFAFGVFQNPLIRKQFIDNPSAIADKFRKIAIYAHSALLLFRPETEGGMAREYTFCSRLQELLLWYIESYPRAKQLTSSLGIPDYDTEVQINFAYAIYILGEQKIIALHEKFGIEYFGRYTEKQLRDLAKKITSGPVPDKPVLLAIYTKYDPNGVFYSNQLEQLMAHYNVIMTEARTESQFYARIYETARTYGNIETLVVGGHGTPAAIQLGAPRFKSGVPTESRNMLMLDLADADSLRDVKNYFVAAPTIILDSCSTGANKGAIGALFSRVLGARLFAPVAPARLVRYKFDRNGKISEVTYSASTAVFERGQNMVPKKIRNE